MRSFVRGMASACLLGALLLPLQPAPAIGGPGSPVSYRGPVPLPSTGALFGAFVKPDRHNGTDRRVAWANFEALVGRHLDIDRQYPDWDDDWPSADDVWSRDQGHTLYFSWKANLSETGECVMWADIAAGLHDAEIDAQAQKIIAFGAPIFFAFHHEPTTHHQGQTCGTPTEYIAAWQHVHDRFVADGVSNVTYAWTMTAWSFLMGQAASYYPGNDTVDVIAADGYNWFGCTYHPGPWRETYDIFIDFYQFGLAQGKPMVIAEYGTGEDPAIPGRKAQWFANFADQVKAWPEIKGVSYYNVGNGSCDRYVDTSPSSLLEFQNMGADPYFNPPVPTTPVTVADFAFSPALADVDRGTEVAWSFAGPSDHSVTDGTSLGLFDSGIRSPGSSFSFSFIGAGTYRYRCSIHPTLMKGKVEVPLGAEPPSGNLSTEFTITWSIEEAPSGRAFGVQIRRPGSSQWSSFYQGGLIDEVFVADSGPGTYAFRARYENAGGVGASGWSVPAQITVTT
jgi:plastocyanin